MSALETSQQIPLQISFIALTGLGDRRWRPSRVLVLSIVASFLSGAYNAGLAIMYNTSLRWGALLNATGIAGGMYTVGSLLLRSMAVTQVVLASPVSGIYRLKLLGVYFVVATMAFYCFQLISLGKHERRFTCRAQLRAVFATFYFVLGPVYLVLEGSAPKFTSISLTLDTVVRLLVVVTVNVLLDVFIFITFAKLNWGICRYSKRRIHFPDRPYLSSTLKCSRFIQLSSIGAVLSIASALSLCYLLMPSFLHGILVNVKLEFRKLMSSGPNQVSGDTMQMSEDQKSLSSGSRRYQLKCGKMIAPKTTRTNCRKFSSWITNFDEEDLEVSRMMSTNSASEWFDESLALRDVEALTSKEMGSPSENLTMHELLRTKASYCTVTNAESCCKNSLQRINPSQKLRNAENGADLDLNVKSKVAEHAPDSDILGQTVELVDRNDAKAAPTLVNDGIELNDGFLLPDSSNEKLTKTNGIHQLGKYELIRTRNGESNGDEVEDDDGSFVPTANVKEHGWSVSKKLTDGRTLRSILGRSISAGKGEKSCAEDKIVRLTSVSLGSSTSFRKLLGKEKPAAQTSIFEKKDA